ncbi:MAG: ABC transporter permease [Bacteroidales bacterium]|jgi:ABC-2 type transport system permease protein|nr:ABC transporter permease [Bacteroidales bacterium]
MVIKYLLEKEFKQFFRSPILPKIVFAYPLLVLLIFPWVTNFNVEDMKVSVVDKDMSEVSRRFIRKVDNSKYFQLYNVRNNYGEALKDIEKGNADVILELPRGFGNDLETSGNPEALVAVNSVNEIKGSLGTGYLSAMLNGFVSGNAKGYGMNMYNPCKDYKLYMIPAIMVMILIILCGFIPALNIVNEKETGTMEQINVTPVSRFSFILAKLIPFWIMGLVSLTIGILISVLVYGMVPQGSFLTIYLGAMLFVFLVSGIGLVISNKASTMPQALFMMFFVVMIFVLMSGLFTPVSSMPLWARCFSYLVPPRYLIDIMRSVYIRGSGIADNSFNFSMLFLFTVLINIWAVLSYRKRT